jgi:hypothetical protein
MMAAFPGGHLLFLESTPLMKRSTGNGKRAQA